jgi:hypothetical protein
VYTFFWGGPHCVSRLVAAFSVKIVIFKRKREKQIEEVFPITVSESVKPSDWVRG